MLLIFSKIKSYQKYNYNILGSLGVDLLKYYSVCYEMSLIEKWSLYGCVYISYASYDFDKNSQDENSLMRMIAAGFVTKTAGHHV